MEKCRKNTSSSPTSPRRLARFSRRVWRGYWQVFGLAGMADQMTGASTGPSSRFQRKPVLLGRSILLTAAGQSRIRTGFPLGVPLGTPPAIDAQDKGLFMVCQSKCCGFWKLCERGGAHSFLARARQKLRHGHHCLEFGSQRCHTNAATRRGV
jgi:hypothetical protein